jgi:hypothetical protein
VLTFLIHAVALNERLNKLSPVPSPSDIIISPDRLAELFGGDNPDIHLGRSGGPPATIFNPVLAMLQQRLDHLERVEVSRVEVTEHAAKYLGCAIEFYKDEKERHKNIESLLDKAIGEPGEWGRSLDWAASKIIPDGCWWHDIFLIMVLELKNTLGLHGHALYQAIVDYSKIVSRDKV